MKEKIQEGKKKSQHLLRARNVCFVPGLIPRHEKVARKLAVVSLGEFGQECVFMYQQGRTLKYMKLDSVQFCSRKHGCELSRVGMGGIFPGLI